MLHRIEEYPQSGGYILLIASREILSFNPAQASWMPTTGLRRDYPQSGFPFTSTMMFTLPQPGSRGRRVRFDLRKQRAAPSVGKPECAQCQATSRALGETDRLNALTRHGSVNSVASVQWFQSLEIPCLTENTYQPREHEKAIHTRRSCRGPGGPCFLSGGVISELTILGENLRLGRQPKGERV